MLYRYQVYGLTLESELECPELAPAPTPADAAVDVRIRLGHVDPELKGAVRVGRQRQIAPGIYQVWVEGIARYRAEGGHTIWVDPEPGADPGDIRAFLLGTLLGITVLLGGKLPLHASAVEVNGEAVAFCGDSGAGKSTLAAALYRRGFELLTDDLGVVVNAPERSLLYPGFQRIKLWRDALQQFTLNPYDLIRDLKRRDKFHWQLGEGQQLNLNPRPLRRVYVLEQSSDARTLIEPISGHAAISALCVNTFGARYSHLVGLRAQNLAQCGTLAARIEVYRYHRPWRLENLEETLTVLLEHNQRTT